MEMTGNTILITGGGSGIGAALAAALLAKGNSVVIAGRREEALREVAEANPGIEWLVADVSTAEGVARLAADALARHPELNVLVNNAGIMRPEDVLADDYGVETAEATVATNLLAPIRLTAALLPHLRAQASAAILNVTSGLAFVPLARTPTYSATKAALHSYSESLRHQLRGTAVEVIEVAPPAVATELMPGHDVDPNSMPLDAYITETMALLENGEDEVLVERVKRLRSAEAGGNYGAVFAMLNPG
jgi:uncharacterized oxidoreductase